MRDTIFRIMSILGLVVLVIMMNTTTPTSVGPLGVLVFFTTLYFIVFVVMRWLVKIVYKIMARKGWKIKDELFAVVLAFAPIMALFMRAFSVVNVLNIVLIAIFELLACFFVSKKF